MIKILKFAKKSWYVMVAVIVLLFVQASCELTLPEYTSNIIDVGISKKGIENIIRSDKKRTMIIMGTGTFPYQKI